MPLPTAEIVYTVVGAISMILYIFVLSSIIHFRRRNEEHFCSAFFAIFISLGVADILSRISSQLFTILPYDSDLQQFYLSAGNADNDLLAKFANFANTFTGSVQYMGHLLISINRFTAFTFAFAQKKVYYYVYTFQQKMLNIFRSGRQKSLFLLL
jgi:multisubunit Na+/H+ antiporter MnhB subunit